MTESVGDLLREDTEKAKVLTATFASVVTSKSRNPGPQRAENCLKCQSGWGKRSWAARQLFQFSLLWAKEAGHQSSIQTSSILSSCIHKEMAKIATKNINPAKYQVFLINTDSLWRCNSENTKEQPQNARHRLCVRPCCEMRLSRIIPCANKHKG